MVRRLAAAFTPSDRGKQPRSSALPMAARLRRRISATALTAREWNSGYDLLRTRVYPRSSRTDRGRGVPIQAACRRVEDRNSNGTAAWDADAGVGFGRYALPRRPIKRHVSVAV